MQNQNCLNNFTILNEVIEMCFSLLPPEIAVKRFKKEKCISQKGKRIGKVITEIKYKIWKVDILVLDDLTKL